MKLPDLPKVPQLLSEEEKIKFKNSLQEWVKCLKELYPTLKEEILEIQRGEETPAPVLTGSIFGPIPALQVTITQRSHDFMIEATLICSTIEDVQAKIAMLFPNDKSTSDNIETA